MSSSNKQNYILEIDELTFKSIHDNEARILPVANIVGAEDEGYTCTT